MYNIIIRVIMFVYVYKFLFSLFSSGYVHIKGTMSLLSGFNASSLLLVRPILPSLCLTGLYCTELDYTNTYVDNRIGISDCDVSN